MRGGLCDLTAERFSVSREAQPLSVGVRSNPPIFPRQARVQLFKLNWNEGITLVSKLTCPLCSYLSSVSCRADESQTSAPVRRDGATLRHDWGTRQYHQEMPGNDLECLP